MRIAFFACNRNSKLFRSDPSYIYRCENLGLELLKQGHQVSFCHLAESINREGFDIVVFHRPRNLWRLRLLIAYFRLRGAKIWADFDDLIFDTQFVSFSPGFVNNINSLEKTYKTYKSHQKTLGLFDGFTVSTEPLRQYLQQIQPKKPIVVIPNAPHSSWEEALAKFPTATPDFSKLILSYLPGTRSHDKDFQLVAEPLTQFLCANKQVSFEITGPLSFQLAADLAGQVQHYEKVEFSRFHERFQSTWVNLAPVENTPFNQGKSALKVLEAGFWGKPTVCSPIPDVLRYENAGAILASTPDEFFNQLTLLLNPSYYAATVHNLRERVLKINNIQQAALSFMQAVNV